MKNLTKTTLKNLKLIKFVIVVVKNSWFSLGADMPYINVKVAGKLTKKQRKEIVTDITNQWTTFRPPLYPITSTLDTLNDDDFSILIENLYDSKISIDTINSLIIK